MTIEIHSNKTAYLYLDSPESMSRLEKLAESEFDRTLQTAGELKATEFHSSLGREYVREMKVRAAGHIGQHKPASYESKYDVGFLQSMPTFWPSSSATRIADRPASNTRGL
jgi:hypothetical protein